MSKERILDVAHGMAISNGFNSLTRDSVAIEAGVAQGTVNHVYGTMAELRNEVMRRALELEDLRLIAQGIACGNQVALSAPQELRLKALTSLAQ